jgi:hypothetical protein
VASTVPLELARSTKGGGGGGSLAGATGAILGMLGTFGKGLGEVEIVEDMFCKLRGDSIVSLLDERFDRIIASLLLRLTSML